MREVSPARAACVCLRLHLCLYRFGVPVPVPVPIPVLYLRVCAVWSVDYGDWCLSLSRFLLCQVGGSSVAGPHRDCDRTAVWSVDYCMVTGVYLCLVCCATFRCGARPSPALTDTETEPRGDFWGLLTKSS
jgi:hypothetical protein